MSSILLITFADARLFDYITYIDQVSTADPMKKQAYDWLKQTINEGGADNELNVFYQYYLLSEEMFKKNAVSTVSSLWMII